MEENNEEVIVKENTKKKEKKKKTPVEWFLYTIVTIITVVITWCACDIFINSNTWYMANVEINDISSITVNYSDGEQFYDNTFYLSDPAYRDKAIDMIYFINNRTPHNRIAQCILRNKLKIQNLTTFFDTNSENYSNEFQVIFTTTDDIEKNVVFSKENKKAFIDYILNEENSSAEEVYQIE